MKFCATLLLIFLTASLVFNQSFIILNFHLNQSYITANFCENKNKPELACNGKCSLVKKLNAEERNEQNNPVNLKVLPAITLFAKSSFANYNRLFISISKQVLPNHMSGKPTDRSIPIFHPPSA